MNLEITGEICRIKETKVGEKISKEFKLKVTEYDDEGNQTACYPINFVAKSRKLIEILEVSENYLPYCKPQAKVKFIFSGFFFEKASKEIAITEIIATDIILLETIIKDESHFDINDTIEF